LVDVDGLIVDVGAVQGKPNEFGFIAVTFQHFGDGTGLGLAALAAERVHDAGAVIDQRRQVLQAFLFQRLFGQHRDYEFRPIIRALLVFWHSC